jgi:MFS family permease
MFIRSLKDKAEWQWMFTLKAKDSLFFSSLFLSRLADQIILFMVPLVIFQLTGSGALSGLAFFIETLPRFLAFPIAGILTDILLPYSIISVSQKVRSFVLPLGLFGFYWIESVYWLMAIAALVGAATSFALMAREMILVQNFSHTRFEKVLSYSSLADQAGIILGPILASVLLTFFNWQQSLTLCIFLFLLSDVSLGYWWRVGIEEQKYHSLPKALKTLRLSSWFSFFVKQLKCAIGQIMSLPQLLPVILMAFCINLILGMTIASMAPIYTGLFAQSESAYALLQSLAVLVSIFILLVIVKVPFNLYWMGGVSFIAMCLGALMTALSQHYLLYLAGFLLIIGFDKMFSIFLRSLRKELIPKENLGKSTGLLIMLNNIAQPIAGLIIAIFAGAFLLQELLLYVAILVIVLGVFIGLYVFYRVKTNK